MRRVTLAEVPCDTPYRQVRIEPHPERSGPDGHSTIECSKLDLLATLGILRSVAGQSEPIVLHQELPFEVVVNTACAGLPIEARLRQELLAEDNLVGRQRRVSDHLSVVIDAITQLGSEGARRRIPAQLIARRFELSGNTCERIRPIEKQALHRLRRRIEGRLPTRDRYDRMRAWRNDLACRSSSASESCATRRKRRANERDATAFPSPVCPNPSPRWTFRSVAPRMLPTQTHPDAEGDEPDDSTPTQSS